MQDRIFREYDIRGIVGADFTIDEMYSLARAIASYLSVQKSTLRTVAVGMDGRIHSPALKEMVCKGLQDSGLDVYFVGICPSPALYFSLFTLPVQAGLMITASHNPKEYNGIKICLGADSVWGTQIQHIAAIGKHREFLTSTHVGTYYEHPIIDHYVEWLATHFNHLYASPINAVVDCGNGTAGTVLPQLVKKMNWHNVQLLFEEVNGEYPHHDPDPVERKNMQYVYDTLATTSATIGVGLDGDCDRMVAMTKSGYLVPGDKMLALFSHQIATSFPGAAVVCDIKSSSGLIELLQAWGCKPVVAPSGHSIIKTYMKQHNALLGGELSCHFFFNDRYFGYDDGIYALLRLFELLEHTHASLDELLTIFPSLYSSDEIRIPCPDNIKSEIIAGLQEFFKKTEYLELSTLDGVRLTTTHGWGIVRASNTQPAICLRFESKTQEGHALIQETFVNALSHYLDPHMIQQYVSSYKG